MTLDGHAYMPSRKTRLVRQRVLDAPSVRLDQLPGDFSLRDPTTILMCGDAGEALKQLPSGTINTSVSSPPYWLARDYGVDGQLGNERSAEEYVSAIVRVYREVKRVLADEGTAWLNIGDTYLSGVGTESGKPPATGWRRNKQLSLIPFRVALALQEDGWWVRNVAIWHKTNAMPESVDDRLANSWEPVFLLTKSERYFFNLDAVREPHLTDDNVERERAKKGTARGKAKGQPDLRKTLASPRHRATIDGMKEVRVRPHAPASTELALYLQDSAKIIGLSTRDVAKILGEPYERVRHYFRTDEIGSRLPPEETWPKLCEILKLDGRYDEQMRVVVRDNVFRNHPMGRNPGDVMPVPTSRGNADHFAMMPERLVEQCLKATLPPNGIVLDPFMGWGTTGKVAHRMGGRFVGVDINPAYVEAFSNK
jgi:DNA modification methylase